MPTKEAIVDSIIPKEVEKPIPTRTVQTRLMVNPALQRDQLNIDKAPSESAAVSAPPAESVKLSPQLSAIARKEQEFRKKEASFKEREKAFETKLLDADKFLKLQEKLKLKDFSSVEELGLDYEGYTNYLLNKQGQDPQKAEMQKLADEMANLKKSQEEKEEEQREAILKDYRLEIKSAVEKDPSYSSIKELGREEVVLQLIIDSLEEDGEELTIEQALKEVEDFSVDEAKKFSSISKLKPKEEPKEEPVKQQPPSKPQLKTLTNQVMVQAPESKPQKSLQHMSESERLEEARRRVMARKQSA